MTVTEKMILFMQPGSKPAVIAERRDTVDSWKDQIEEESR